MGIRPNISQHNTTTNNMTADAAKKAPAKPKAPAAHPKYSVMIAAAITALKDRTGSSRQAILKYIYANYKVDAAKAGQHLRMALKAGIKKGTLKMAKESGKGAGCFKLVKVEKPKKAKKVVKPKKPAVKKAKKAPAKKAAKPKKAAKAKKAPAKKAAKPKKAAPAKAKKPAAKKPAAKKPAA